jgi:hypothetical protein
VVRDEQLAPGERVVIVPATYDAAFEERFTLVAFTEYQVCVQASLVHASM